MCWKTCCTYLLLFVTASTAFSMLPSRCQIDATHKVICCWGDFSRMELDGQLIPKCYHSDIGTISEEKSSEPLNAVYKIPTDIVESELFDPIREYDPYIKVPASSEKAASTNVSLVSPAQTSNPNKLSLVALLQMKRDQVPQPIISSLMADAIPNGEFLFALSDGRLDVNEIIKLSRGSGIEFNPILVQYLTPTGRKKILYGKIAQAYGIDPIAVQLIMTNNKASVMKHLVSQLSAKSNLDPMSSFVLTAVTSGGVTKDLKTSFLVEQIFKEESSYSREALKAILLGDKNKARKWAFLASTERYMPLKKYYPKNEALFAYLVDTQKNFPGKISPSIILALAQNYSIKALGNRSFANMFGIKANNYVCLALDSDLKVGCKALEGRLYPSSLDCINAGCCIHTSSQSSQDIECHQNIFGDIGLGIAEKVWDESYIANTLFGGTLPTLANFYPNGVPWMPPPIKKPDFTNFLNKDPTQPSWFSLLKYRDGIYLPPRPTLVPIGPNKFRPNFVWKPHGATPFPSITEMPPGNIPLATHSPGVINGIAVRPNPPYASVFAITPPPFVSCKAVLPKARRQCLSNYEALREGGDNACVSRGCCYDPIWKDFRIPACFFKPNYYGQCSNIDNKDRRECGSKGISKTECLKDPRCCYDSTINAETWKNPPPWCYFKTEVHYHPSETCSMTPYALRQPCFVDTFKHVTSEVIGKRTCEAIGCCYERVKFSYLHQTLTNTIPPPACYKYIPLPPIPTIPTTTTASTASTASTVAPVPSCSASLKLDPRKRTDCGRYFYHSCVKVKGCCYHIPDFSSYIPGAPWCFRKS